MERALVIGGMVGMLIGAIDPLEGSLLILPASILLTLGVRRAKSGIGGRLATVGLVLIGLGFTAMWIMTALGGVGGSTGRSAWWALLALPMLPGWSLCVVGGVLSLRERADAAWQAPAEEPQAKGSAKAETRRDGPSEPTSWDER